MKFNADTRYAVQQTTQNFLFAGFTPCPNLLLSGMTEEQAVWWQAIYAKAYAEAHKSVGYRVLVPAFERVARN